MFTFTLSVHGKSKLQVDLLTVMSGKYLLLSVLITKSLHIDQPFVQTVLIDQLLMIALFCNAAVF